MDIITYILKEHKENFISALISIHFIPSILHSNKMYVLKIFINSCCLMVFTYVMYQPTCILWNFLIIIFIDQKNVCKYVESRYFNFQHSYFTISHTFSLYLYIHTTKKVRKTSISIQYENVKCCICWLSETSICR